MVTVLDKPMLFEIKACLYSTSINIPPKLISFIPSFINIGTTLAVLQVNRPSLKLIVSDVWKHQFMDSSQEQSPDVTEGPTVPSVNRMFPIAN